jgi:hypothetical protein
MKHLRGFLLAAAIFGGLLAPIPSSGALGLEVAPAKIEMAMPSGTTYNMPITVHNASTDPTHIQASMVDFTIARNGDYEFQRVGAREYSLLRWASINPREFDLASNTTQMERLTFALPRDKGLSGEYAGIVFFQTRPLRRAGAFAFSERIATKIYLSIPGTVKVAGEIAKMSAAQSSSGQLYRVLFRNTGNAHVYLNGSLSVQRDGQVVDQLAVPAEQLVERGGDRLLEISGKRLPPGKYQALAAIDYGGKTMTGGEISFNVR